MLVFFLTALIPIVVGFVYYSEPVAGKLWMRLNGFSKESLENGNFVVILGLSYVFGLFLCYVLWQLVIHQTGIVGTLAMDPTFMEEGSDVNLYFKDFLNRFGDNHRTFGHGALHGGFVAGLGFALPLIAINALFERKSWKYIAVHAVYWIITLALMGGIICQFSPYPSATF